MRRPLTRPDELDHLENPVKHVELDTTLPMGRVLLEEIERGTVLWDDEPGGPGDRTILDHHLTLHECR